MHSGDQIKKTETIRIVWLCLRTVKWQKNSAMSWLTHYPGVVLKGRWKTTKNFSHVNKCPSLRYKNPASPEYKTAGHRRCGLLIQARVSLPVALQQLLSVSLCFYREDGESRFLRNVGTRLKVTQHRIPKVDNLQGFVFLSASNFLDSNGKTLLSIIKLTLEQAMKAQKRSTGIALLLL